jgi:hypothetical protein
MPRFCTTRLVNLSPPTIPFDATLTISYSPVSLIQFPNGVSLLPLACRHVECFLTIVYRGSEASPIRLRRIINSPTRSPRIRRPSQVPLQEPQISPALFSMAENEPIAAGECLREKRRRELEKPPLLKISRALTPGRSPSMALTGLMDSCLLWLDPSEWSHRRTLRAHVPEDGTGDA